MERPPTKEQVNRVSQEDPEQFQKRCLEAGIFGGSRQEKVQQLANAYQLRRQGSGTGLLSPSSFRARSKSPVRRLGRLGGLGGLGGRLAGRLAGEVECEQGYRPRKPHTRTLSKESWVRKNPFNPDTTIPVYRKTFGEVNVAGTCVKYPTARGVAIQRVSEYIKSTGNKLAANYIQQMLAYQFNEMQLVGVEPNNDEINAAVDAAKRSWDEYLAGSVAVPAGVKVGVTKQVKSPRRDYSKVNPNAIGGARSVRSPRASVRSSRGLNSSRQPNLEGGEEEYFF